MKKVERVKIDKVMGFSHLHPYFTRCEAGEAIVRDMGVALSKKREGVTPLFSPSYNYSFIMITTL